MSEPSDRSSSSTPPCATASRRPASRWTCRRSSRMARALDALGVDIIEAGFPIASPADSEATRSSPSEVRRPVIAALARCRPQDIDEAAPGARAGRTAPHSHLPGDLRPAPRAQAAHHPRGLSRADHRRRQARPPVHRRCGVFGGGCDAQRSRFPVPGRRGGRSTPAPPPSTCPTPSATPCPKTSASSSRIFASASPTPTRPSSARTATTTSGWPSPTAWRPFRAACARSSARSTASASAPATPRSKRS